MSTISWWAYATDAHPTLISSSCLSIEMHIHVYNAQTKVRRLIEVEANHSVNPLDFRLKSFGYAGIIFLNTTFPYFDAYPNLPV